MNKYLAYLILSLLFLGCNPAGRIQNDNEMYKHEPITGFEKNPNSTATYYEAISFYENLSEKYDQLRITPFGMTDSGHPLHEVVLSGNAEFDPNTLRQQGKTILFINNAIHPGEPCGVDATMMLIRNYLKDPGLSFFLDKVVLVVVPVYNIGGALNRNSHTRTNQIGPEFYGFRGNARNLDLNRDFIKCDSKNAASFNQLFAKWDPDVMVDNHTSNGADYQYTMTLIATQKDKLDLHLGQYLEESMLPVLYNEMKERNDEMTPYVFSRNTPDEGISDFLDLARYSSGYAALFNTLSFMPETHMLKPYRNRVESTYRFMDVMIRTIFDQQTELHNARRKAKEHTADKQEFDLNWVLDMHTSKKILFKGYEAKYKKSEVTGMSRLYYDRSAPYEKVIPHYHSYNPSVTVRKPFAYVFPQAYSEIVERLQWNGVKVQQLSHKHEFQAEFYRIGDFKNQEAFEGHYLHFDVEVEKEVMVKEYNEGDYLIIVDQPTNRYIVETLEPQGPDSYFAWNFFDGILMQKEYFSSYVFEDLAAEYLKNDPQLRKALEDKKKSDPEFGANARAQLDFVYKRTPHYEKTHRVYPVARVLTEMEFDVE